MGLHSTPVVVWFLWDVSTIFTLPQWFIAIHYGLSLDIYQIRAGFISSVRL